MDGMESEKKQNDMRQRMEDPGRRMRNGFIGIQQFCLSNWNHVFKETAKKRWLMAKFICTIFISEFAINTDLLYLIIIINILIAKKM